MFSLHLGNLRGNVTLFSSLHCQLVWGHFDSKWSWAPDLASLPRELWWGGACLVSLDQHKRVYVFMQDVAILVHIFCLSIMTCYKGFAAYPATEGWVVWQQCFPNLNRTLYIYFRLSECIIQDCKGKGCSWWHREGRCWFLEAAGKEMLRSWWPLVFWVSFVGSFLGLFWGCPEVTPAVGIDQEASCAPGAACWVQNVPDTLGLALIIELIVLSAEIELGWNVQAVCGW